MKKLFGFALLLFVLLAAMPVLAEEENLFTPWSDVIGEHVGELKEAYGISNYITHDGVTSAIIGEEAAGSMIWLKEESAGRSAWYGLDNSEGVFEQGSRFWVKRLSAEQDSTEWQKYYDALDDEHKYVMEEDRLWIFQIGVTSPDGKPYENLRQAVSTYVELDDDWDKQNLRAVHIEDGVDENVDLMSVNNIDEPEGTGDFAKLTLSHFSPYAIYEDASTMSSSGAAVDPDGFLDLPQTGDTSRMGLWLVLLAFSGAAGLVLLLRRREN